MFLYADCESNSVHR